MSALRHRWNKTTDKAGVATSHAGLATQVYEAVWLAYMEPHRRYHGISHLRSCFNVLDRYFGFSAIKLPAEVEMALWFHDVRYDTRALDNEEQSATYAGNVIQERLELPAAFAQDVRDLILATKHQHPTHSVCEDDHAVQLVLAKHVVLDVDLSILGAQSEAFDEYERQIREEYGWVSEEAFRGGRSRIVQEFLQRPRIFYNSSMHDAGYEDRARGNLRRSLAALGGAQ